jgi:hypothetical protein
MVRELCYSIINARIPQEPPLAVVDEVAVARKADRDSNVGPWCPTRFVGAVAVTAVNHVETIYPGLDFRTGAAEASHARDGGPQRQDGNQQDPSKI